MNNATRHQAISFIGQKSISKLRGERTQPRALPEWFTGVTHEP